MLKNCFTLEGLQGVGRRNCTMNAKKKYPKSFYDDGLGDFLEWIDDEVLIHTEKKILHKEERAKRGSKAEKEQAKKLYGNNDVTNLERSLKASRRARSEAEIEISLKQDKNLENRVRGLINRLAAQTMPFVVSEFEKLYATNSRQLVNEALFSNINCAIISKAAITKRKLIAELMLLASHLSSTVSQDIGASLVHQLIRQFEELYSASDDEQDDKRLDNVLICLLNLYTIGLVSAHVIFEISKRIFCTFKVRSIELLLIILKSVGFQLRKESPVSMRQLIITTQEKCTELKQRKVELGSRLEFMMEALGAIKNNNVGKLRNYGCDIDKDTIESTLKLLIKRPQLAQSLSDASYEEILYSPNWYLLETRVVEENRQETTDNGVQPKPIQEPPNKTDDKICKLLGLNKPTERTIFRALLKASDYVEASNIIIGFGLNYCSDAIIVALHVAIHEKKYNPFYFNLINSLCKFNRKYKMATKFSIQDKIRALSSMTSARVATFKRLCFDLIKSDAIPMTVLKAVEWANMSGSTKEFLTYLLEAVSDLSEDENRKIMMKVDRKSSFAGAMRTFSRCFLKGCKLFQ